MLMCYNVLKLEQGTLYLGLNLCVIFEPMLQCYIDGDLQGHLFVSN